jgi:hypothetical protein
MSKEPVVFEGPDGRLYEVPADVLAQHAVPPERVAELRKRTAVAAAPAAHYRPGEQPSHIPPPPASLAAPTPTAISIPAPNGGTIVLNIYIGGAPAPGAEIGVSPAGTVEGYHMTFDATGIPANHTDMLWGDFIDKQGKPAVGWHSHDPVTGNAQ